METFEERFLKNLFESFSSKDKYGKDLFDRINDSFSLIIAKLTDESIPEEIRTIYHDLSKPFIQIAKSIVRTFEILSRKPIFDLLVNAKIANLHEIELLNEKKISVNKNIRKLEKIIKNCKYDI